MAFSQGAALGALMLAEDAAKPAQQQLLPFKCAIFLSGITPCDHQALENGQIRWLDPDRDHDAVKVPTAHIWGSKDVDYPGHSEVLSKLCTYDRRRVFVHNGGHGIPATRDEGLLEAVNAIQETIRSI